MTGSVVLNVCAECGITAEEFFGNGRTRGLVHARRVAIERLHDAGFNYRAVSRLIRRRYSTVMYWVHAEERERRREYLREYHKSHPHVRTPKTARKHLKPEQRLEVLNIYLSQGYHAAKPVLASYGIGAQQLSLYARLAGIKGKPGPARSIPLANCMIVEAAEQRA